VTALPIPRIFVVRSFFSSGHTDGSIRVVQALHLLSWLTGSAFFWDVTQRRMVIVYWRFGKTCRSGLVAPCKMGPIRCPETSVKDYHSTLRNIPEERRSHQHRVGSLKSWIATGWTVRESNPGGGEVFHARPDRPWGPASFLYDGYRVPFPRIKRPGRDVDHPPLFSSELEERVKLYVCSRLGFHGLF
jgi:hypothetical protein